MFDRKGCCCDYNMYFCDRVIMINKGIVIKQGTPQQIKEDTGTTNLRDAFFTMIGGGSDEE